VRCHLGIDWFKLADWTTEVTAGEVVSDGGAGGFPRTHEFRGSNQNAMGNQKAAAPPPNGHRSCSGEHLLRQRTVAKLTTELRMMLRSNKRLGTHVSSPGS
jgi:hypothetical protein